MREQFRDEEIREVLTRADEIQQQENLDVEVGRHLQEVVAAAEESGLSRNAIMQAIRERQSVVGVPPKVGSLVFAPIQDDRLYVAEVAAIDGEIADIHMLGGSDLRVHISDLRPFQLLPGQKVRCNWPNWGWWTGIVIRFDRENRFVRVSDGWGSEHTFPISEVYVQTENLKAKSRSEIRKRIAAWLITSFVAGASVGTLISWLIMR